MNKVPAAERSRRLPPRCADQVAPRRKRALREGHQDGPKGPPDGSKKLPTWRQVASLGWFLAPLGRKIPPTWLLLAPFGPILAPSWLFQGRPKMAKAASKRNLEPRWPQIAPKTAQNAPRSIPRPCQASPRCSQNHPKTSQDPRRPSKNHSRNSGRPCQEL